ncbi:hypothetical protein FACS1894172_15760 [Spirochaetia bacterium]|nr:hypothetical protein FACS1894164_09550 [Spirochaetia bacterium]GHU34869.1 hypothetical protein FACS1894172_15760 [Spirochaetia bacterium]
MIDFTTFPIKHESLCLLAFIERIQVMRTIVNNCYNYFRYGLYPKAEVLGCTPNSDKSSYQATVSIHREFLNYQTS